MQKKNSKSTLVIVCTHGDEDVGLNAVNLLKNRGISLSFDFEIGNPLALKKGVRFIDVDQNRVAPGDLASSLYEERRVAELLQKAINYYYILDIHGTSSNSGIFIIISKLTKENIIFALQLPIKRVVVWESTSKQNSKGSITKFLKKGLGIEIGPKDDEKILMQLADVLGKINSQIKKYTSELNEKELKILIKQKEFYRVYGSLSSDEILDKNKKMLNFIQYKNGDEYFYPILPGEYQGKIYYKAEKISYKEISLFVK